MSTPSMIPMIAPDGSVGMVPTERVAEAIQHGGTLGVKVQAPTGEMGIIPRVNLPAALKNGGKLIQDSANYQIPSIDKNNKMDAQQIANLTVQKGLGIGTGIANTVAAPIETSIEMRQGVAQGYNQAKQRGAGKLETAASTIAPIAGIDPGALADAAQKRDYARMIIEGGTPVAAAIGGEIGGRLPEASFTKSTVSAGAKGMPQVASFPDLGKLSPTTVGGLEDIYRASAPTGTNTEYRGNVAAAKGDLAEIGRNLNMDQYKGGISNPDMRVRALRDAITDYKQQMYQNERAPQIQRNADTPIATNKFGADATEGLKYVQRTAGTAVLRGLAEKAMNDGTLTTAEADQLAQAVNKKLLDFEHMSPTDRATAQITDRRLGALKALDRSFSGAINNVLQSAGEPGLYSYERRFAALSEIEHQLGTRMNAVELNQPGPIKAVVKPVLGAVKGGPTGIASASQAAVADVNIGRMLQRGLQRLAESDLQPER